VKTPKSSSQSESYVCLDCRRLLPVDAGWPKRLSSSTFSYLDFIGDAKILSGSLTAIFCSSRCTGDAILRTTKWIGEIADDESQAIVGGFHSAMEKGFLEILLEGRCRLVVCPARCLERYRVPGNLKAAIESRRLTIVSSLPKSVRFNSEISSRQRNQLVADLADHIVVTYSSPHSRTEKFALELLRSGKQIHCLNTGCDSLVAAGAEVVTFDTSVGGC